MPDVAGSAAPTSSHPHCPDCAEYPVNHTIEWFSSLIDSVTEPFFAPLDIATQKLWHLLGKPSLSDQLALPFLRTLAFLRLGTIQTDIDERDSVRAKLMWQAAKARDITLYQFLARGRFDGLSIFVARTADGRSRVFEGLPRPQRGTPPSLTWMDNKATLKKKFLAAGIPIAQGRGCRTWRQALETFERVGAPVITKPNIGSRGRHSSVHIMDKESLKKGFDSAKQLSPWVVVEQELQGDLFRVLLVDGKPVSVLRREAAHVEGDGISTIRTLAEKENKDPRRQGPTFHHLPMDNNTRAELERQGCTWESVPKRNAVVTLSPHISRYLGGTTTDFTDRVHPENIALFEYIAKVLDDSLVGIDFIINDIARPWREQKFCGVVECNSLPNIQLHSDVFCGKSLDVAGLLLDLVFPQKEAKQDKTPQ
jgi:D-alanine-D-alanine ligase-like ATP-grasp enzyme